LRYRNGLPVLTVAGSPEEIGEAVGALAVRPAPRMTGYPEDCLREFRVGWLRGLLTWLGEGMVRRFPGAYRRELEAVVRAGGVERQRVVLGNTLFDLKKFFACSALLVEPGRSATGAPLLGRNLDYPSLGYAHEYSLVTVYRPEGARHAFATVGFPGLLGCLSGCNDAGLCLAVLEVFQAAPFTCRLDRSGTPYALCFRRLLEECATVEEAHALLGRLRRTTICNLAVADARRTAVFEVTTRRVVRREPRDGACFCTNHFCSPGLGPLWAFNVYQTFDRHDALRRAARGGGRLGVAELHDGLHAARNAKETLQTMVFEPAARRLHLGIGAVPSSAVPLRTLDLGPLLAGWS
jgi:hypothetical protein